VRFWYCVPHKNEVGSYIVDKTTGETTFNKGILYAYGDCCLVTGLKSEEEARKGITEYPCQREGKRRAYE